jgi:hypothetical protein
LVLAASLLWPNLHEGMPGADETYEYMVVLSILFIHYLQDAFLFTDTRAIVAG